MPLTFKRTKILATLGPSTSSPDMIQQLIEAGANGIRLNFSHGTHEERLEQIPWIREASAKIGKPVAILQDLQGPKIRLGALLDNRFEVKKGDEIVLDYAVKEHDGSATLPVQYNLAEKAKVGEPIYIFDGKVRTTVLEVVSETAIKLRVENDGILMSKKGINLPDTDFGGDILTEKDRKDIEFGLTQDIDFVALSFVQSADDIHALRQILTDGGSNASIIAKIETKAAIKDGVMEEIVKATDGIMVARGDLAVEAGPEVVPIVQRKLIALCRRYGKMSIVATQMMASMVDNPEPTRAEVSDVANAVLQGADTVMLSDETANGHYPLETVTAMKKVIVYTQDQAPVNPVDDIIPKDIQLNAISGTAVLLAKKLKVDAIIAETKSGATAKTIAEHRPNLPIISVTSRQRTAQNLSLSYANRSYVRPDSSEAGFELFKELKAQGYFGDGVARVIIVSGQQPGVTGTTDTIKVRVLE